MKSRILLIALCLGILVGVTLFSFQESLTITGASTCYVENEPCTCEGEECICGEQTVPLDYCLSRFK